MGLNAAEYIYENTGVNADNGAFEYVSSNDIDTSRDAHEYAQMNAGVALQAPIGGFEYLFEGDVDTGVAVPSIWFVHASSGFAGDLITIYGIGMGALADTDSTHLWWYPADGTAAIDMSIDSWTAQPASADAYDANRLISSGPGVEDPFANVECEILVAYVPLVVAPSIAAGPRTDQLCVVDVNGSSNLLPWQVYPGIEMPLAVMLGSLHGMVSLSMVSDPEAPSTAIEQPYAVIIPEPYIITGSLAERKPLFGAYSKTSAAVSANYSATAGLEEALATTMQAGTPGHMLVADSRWLPDADMVVARDDLGSGLTTWLPIQGSQVNWLEQYADSAGYVDPTYQYVSRNGLVNKPAMVMDGTAWLRLNTDLATGPTFTVAMVVMLHESKYNAQLLTSFSDTPVNGDNPLAFSQEGDSVAVYIGAHIGAGATAYGGKVLSKPLSGMNRPVIIAFSSNGTYSSIVVVDHTPKNWYVKHPPLTAANLRVYLGRPPVLLPQSNEGIMNGEILDLSLWHVTMTTAQLLQVTSKLDGIYGVTG